MHAGCLAKMEIFKIIDILDLMYMSKLLYINSICVQAEVLNLYHQKNSSIISF